LVKSNTKDIDSILVLSPWPEDHERDQELIQRAIDSHEKGSYEQRFLRPDGSTGYYFSTFQGIYNDDSELTAIKGTVQDTTKRKLAELALQESEATARALLNAPEDIVLLFDTNYTLIDVNETAVKTYEKPREKLIGLCVWDLLSKDLVKSRKPYVDKLIQTGEPVRFEDEREGTWFDNVLYPIFDDQHNVEKIAVIARDITERKQMEIALEENYKHYQTLFESANDAIMIMENGKFIECNEKAVDVFKRDAKQNIIGFYPWDFSPPSQPDGEDSQIKAIKFFRAAEDGKPQSFYWKHVYKDGTPFHVDVSLNRIDIGNKNLLLAIIRDITKQKQTEKALQENVEHYQTLFESANDAIFIMEDDKYIECNEMATKIFKCDNKQEIIGHYPWAFSPPSQPGGEDSKKKASRVIQAALDGNPQRFYWMHIQKDGTPFHVEVSLSRINIGNKKTLFAIIRDITERKQAEEVIRERQEFIKALIETSQEWIWSIDLQGNHTYCNPAVEAILGYSPDDMIGHNSLNLMHDEDRKTIEEKLPEWIEKKCGWTNLLISWRHKNGSWRYLESNSVPIFDSNSNLIGFRGIDRDITERKQTEEVMKKSAIIIDSASDAVITTNTEGIITFWNNGAEKIYGYQKDEVLGKPISIIYKKEDLHVLGSMITELLNGKEIPGIEVTCIDKNQKDVVILLSLTSIKDKDGNIIELVGIMKDITETKRLRNLESRASRLEMAGTLAGQVAHDFNNLLAPILAYPDYIRDTLPIDHEAHSCLEDMVSAARKMADINQDLLTLGRRGYYSQKPFNLNDVIRQAIKDQ